MQELLSAVGPNAKRGIRSQINIQKARIKKGCLSASFTEQLDNEMAGRKFENVECGDRAHSDLLNAFRKLVPHFCLITAQVSPFVLDGTDEDDRAKLLSDYDVTGLSYDKGGSGFTLTGTRKIDTDQPLNLNTPFVTFDWARENGYDELVDLLHGEVNQEIELGLRGKCADAGRQLPLPFDQPEGVALLGAGEGGPKLLGEGAEDVEWEDVDEDGGPDGEGKFPEPSIIDEQPEGEEPAAGDQTSPDEPEPPKKRGPGRPRNPKPQA
ncbi:MAG: hypothetical protein H7330_14855 [Hymenobacteraceae bacterium]|nr:hypothetical protein [Hymenobacteraceae bacterium]